MLKPSKKLALALEAVVDVAYHGGTDPVQSHEIARRLGLPRRYLEQVLQLLVRKDVLKGVRGPKGGYRLARERRHVTVAEVLRALQGVDDPQEDSAPDVPSELGGKVLGPLWNRVAGDLLARLDEVTVEDLCRDAERCSVPSEGRDGIDFAI